MSEVAYELLMGLAGLVVGVALIFLWAVFFQNPDPKGPLSKLSQNNPQIFATFDEILARHYNASRQPDEDTP